MGGNNPQMMGGAQGNPNFNMGGPNPGMRMMGPAPSQPNNPNMMPGTHFELEWSHFLCLSCVYLRCLFYLMLKVVKNKFICLNSNLNIFHFEV